MLDFTDLLIIFGAAFAAGFINTLAGGGTLLSFPVLLALGIPPLNANITNTIALCPGYFGGIWAQRKELILHSDRLLFLLPVSILGGMIGGLLLVHSDESSFEALIPFLILIACLLLAIQESLKKIMQSHGNWHITRAGTLCVLFLLFLSAVYGGYFGAGVSVIILAFLGLLYDDTLTSLNALKQTLAFSINVTAAIFFLFSGMVEWGVMILMGIGSIIGGFGGGKCVGMISAVMLRWTVVSIGILIAIAYAIRG